MEDGPLIDPTEFCLLLKQVDRQPPRMSRDLEPDFIGIDLKQQILDAIIAAGPPRDGSSAPCWRAPPRSTSPPAPPAASAPTS